MNGRTVPWRKKPTQDIQDTFADAIELKLYLLQEIGPTSFVFKDENENKFKVSIGHEISCSCSPHRKDHCIHTLYVCFKIFKLNQDNPLVWQASYIDSEIADIMRSRFNPSTSQKPKRTNFLKKSTNPMLPSKDKGGKNRQALGEDDMCPICHEDLSEEEGTTFCKKGCGNNFHIKCSLIWAEHRHKIGDAISCPMCRCDWGARAYETLVKEFQDFESRLILHKGHKCGGCKSTKPKSIKGKLFRCVYCDNFELCEKCFQNFEHFEHHRYLVKENINAEWRPAQNRDKSLMNPHTKNSLDVFNEIMGYGNFNLNSQMGLMNNLRSFNRPGENMYEGDNPENFILSCFPDANSDFEAALSGKPNNLAIIGHDVKKNCSYCHTDKMDVSKLKRLNCGHVMHGHCILEMVSNKNFRCPDDSLEFLKGYKNACCPRENPAVVPPSQNTPQKVAVIAQNGNKAMKKPFEEQKTNLNKNNKIRLGPLDLDIKGKAVSGANDANMESPGIVDMGDLYKPKASSILMKNMMKKPPTHGKALMKANTREVTLPPLFEIQGTNLNNNGNNSNATAEQQQQQPAPKSVGKVIKKPLMQIQQNSSNSMSERPSPLSVNNFRIVPSSLKVQPRKTRKSTNPASLKSVPKSREEEVNVAVSKSSERNYAVSAQNVEQNEDYENNLTDYEEVENENY